MSELARLLLCDGHALSQRVLDIQYRDAFWSERFGDRGRRHADEDSDFHLQYLARALDANDGAILVRYARWLRDVLASRGMCTRHLDENFRLLAAQIEAQSGWPNREAALGLLGEARGALLHTHKDARWIQDHEATLTASQVVYLRTRGIGWKRDDARGAEGLADDAANYWSYVADALALGDPRTLVEHAVWLVRHVCRHGVSAEEAQAFLAAAAEALEARGPATARAYLAAAAALPHAPA